MDTEEDYPEEYSDTSFLGWRDDCWPWEYTE